jgi:tRNA pseudouridine38-40 synthase
MINKGKIMPTLALKIEYDGSDYCGWQMQNNAPSVQGVLNNVFRDFLDCQSIATGAGRTDSGVHARGMIASVPFEHELKIPEAKLAKALNTQLPDDIRIQAARIFEQDFNARFDATSREYSYNLSSQPISIERRHVLFYKFPFDPEVLIDSATVFLGEHDFTTFSKMNPATKHHMCNVEKCEWNEISKNRFQLQIKANRFVYGMVRCLVGAMLTTARGRNSIEELRLALNKKDRELQSPLAPAHGLIFEKAYYPPHLSF